MADTIFGNVYYGSSTRKGGKKKKSSSGKKGLYIKVAMPKLKKKRQGIPLRRKRPIRLV